MIGTNVDSKRKFVTWPWIRKKRMTEDKYTKNISGAFIKMSDENDRPGSDFPGFKCRVACLTI